METVIRRNYEYFNENILGYYYIFTTNKNESIVVKTAPENLSHLLGTKYATQNGLFRYSGTRFYL
ncbi:PBECR4 domain-containing protein [Floccifex sp.]|uniref:PBECR4 domain-containing protein n=1 Tax=Floccifex sp. TaxID=2815810 RepID=UPI003F0AF01C